MSKSKKVEDVDEFDCTMTTYLDSPDLVEYELEFHQHAKNNNIDKMQHLINKKVDVNCVNKLDRTAAHFAAASGHEEALMILKEANADFELEDKCGMTPILWAGFYGHLPVVKLLFHMFRCRVEATNKAGMNLVHIAASNGQLILLDYISTSITKLNATQRDKKGRTPFHIAAQEGFDDVIRTLFRFRRYDLNAKDHHGRTALHYAAEKGYVDVVNVLLEREADFDIEDEDLKSPLYCAVENGHVEIIDRFLDFEHYPVTVHRFQNRKSILHVAAALNHHLVITRFAHRCKLEALNEVRNTAIHQAILSKNPLCVQALLRCGSSVNAVTIQGDTPLHLAAQQNNPEIVYLLLQCPDIDLYKANKRGKTALYVAAQGSFLGIVDMIIRAQLLQTRAKRAAFASAVAAKYEGTEDDTVDAKPRMRRQVTFADDVGSLTGDANLQDQISNDEPPEEKSISLAAFRREKDEELRGIRERRKVRNRPQSEQQSEHTVDSIAPPSPRDNNRISKISSGVDSVRSAGSGNKGSQEADADNSGKELSNAGDVPDCKPLDGHHGHHHHHHHHQKTKYSRRSESGRVISPEKRLRHQRDYIDLASSASTPFDLYHDGLTRANEMTDFNLISHVLHYVAFKILRPDSWRDLATIWMFSHEQIRIICQQEIPGSENRKWRNHAYRMLRIWFSSLPEHDYANVTKLLIEAVEMVTSQKHVKELKKFMLKTEVESLKKVTKLSKNIKSASKNPMSQLRRRISSAASISKRSSRTSKVSFDGNFAENQEDINNSQDIPPDYANIEQASPQDSPAVQRASFSVIGEEATGTADPNGESSDEDGPAEDFNADLPPADDDADAG